MQRHPEDWNHIKNKKCRQLIKRSLTVYLPFYWKVYKLYKNMPIDAKEPLTLKQMINWVRVETKVWIFFVPTRGIYLVLFLDLLIYINSDMILLIGAPIDISEIWLIMYELGHTFTLKTALSLLICGPIYISRWDSTSWDVLLN